MLLLEEDNTQGLVIGFEGVELWYLFVKCYKIYINYIYVNEIYIIDI